MKRNRRREWLSASGRVVVVQSRHNRRMGAGAAFAGLIIDELEGMLDGRRAGDAPHRGEAPRHVDQHTPPPLAPAEEPKGLLGAGDPDSGGDEGDVDGPMDSESRDLPYPSSP